MKRVHVKIYGIVQGISFRRGIQQKAKPLKIKGWVQNTDDGALEGIFEGEEENLRQVLEYCQKGPDGAKVKKMDIYWHGSKDEFTSFKIIK